MQTRHRIATAAVGLALVTAPALALAAPSGAAPTPSPTAPTLDVRSTAPTTRQVTLPSASAAPTAPRVVVVPVRGSDTPGIAVPAGHVSVGRGSSDDTAVIALGAVGALLLIGGTTVAIRRRS